MRLAVPLTILAVAAALLAGCGGSSSDRGSTAGGPAQGEKQASPQGSSPSAPIGASAKSCETQAVDAGGLRATGISCGQARQVMLGWQRESSCSLPSGASRGGCLTRSYRCQAVRGGRGTAVSCSRPGESIAFVARRR